MDLTKLYVYLWILVQCLVQNTFAADDKRADELKRMEFVNTSLHYRLDNRNNRINTEDDSHLQTDFIPNKIINKKRRSSNSDNNKDDNDFHFLVTGGYRPENNPLAKFLVSLRLGPAKIFGSNHICGGSILSKKAIVTAAHCININSLKLVSRQLTVVVGTPRRLVKTENTQELRVEKLMPHPKWGVSVISNDVGIVKLKDEIRLDDNFASVIPLNDRDPIGLNCTVIGWGSIVYKGPSPDEPVSGDLVINSLDYCSQSSSTKKGFVCASNPNSFEVASCQGDSGGPLICDGKLTGIVSHGTGGATCGGPKSFTFFTDVYYFRDWITRNAACEQILQFPCSSKLSIIIVYVFIFKRYI